MMRMSTTLCAVLLISSGCYGGNFAKPAPEDAADDGAASDETSGGDDDESGGEPPAFFVPGEEVTLLPYSVRLRNLSNLLGVAESSPLFSSLFVARFQLGAHDYASGVAPDLTWSAEKMQAWVKALRPVCASAQFKDKFPTLLDDPTPLLRQTLGREPTEAERADLEALATAPGQPQNARYELVCLAALSSLEFVAI